MARILVVDDEPAVREALAILLAHLGHAVTEARDGEDALDCFQRDEFDLILTDVMMPGMNGFELMRRIQAGIQYRIPLVVLSSHDDGDDIQTAIYAGAFDYIVKPANPRRVADVVDRALLQGRIWAEEGTPPPDALSPQVTDAIVTDAPKASGCAAMATAPRTVTVPKPSSDVTAPPDPAPAGPLGKLFRTFRRR